ncbi:Aste57867_12263 [Aphanomyces stellatus]|uniref:Aste57867_12263 protein n=1 Tax=Aphanomyces stellatus TaxID=120398 RepID=A0A485KV35_9STRA|nr:hypothetical protein As57867_012218 [Aphanomyces stellatus]VFT89116.1 Aste57867_12263 [Aphanomyces stellatus]
MAGPENTHGDLKDEDVVAVGSISNVLRRAFRDYYTDDFDQNLNAEWDVEANQASAIPPDHPYLVYAKERVGAIEANLHEKVSQASQLMALLETRRQEAAAKDEQQARDLIAQGLVVKAQIPIGPSNFTLRAEELAPFGEFATSLIHAHDLMQENHLRMLDRSGNGPTAQIKAAKAAVEVPGYFKTTASVSIRKESTLHKHQHEGDDEYVSEFVDDVTQAISDAPKKPKKQKAAQLSTDEELLNASILTRMQSTLQFSRNPRYDKTNEAINELAPPFQVVPNPVEFTSYEMGGIYEQLVLIKNVSSIAGRCRILPPSSAFFMISSVMYPESSGLIAPGLSCQVRIQFAPDTRADYTDTFLVMLETPSGTDIPIQVQLAAHRDPPQLSIPTTLLASCCLIGGTSKTTITCLNSGGKGRFWFLSETAWAAADTPIIDHIHLLQHDGVDPSKTLQLGPFLLGPCDIELDKGESVDLELVYTPRVVGTEHATFLVVCDNCLVKPFYVSGRGCEIDLTPITINKIPIELSIASMGPLDRLLFAPIMTNASSTQTFQLFNDTPLDLTFEWALTNPVFSIAPAAGVLSQTAAATFVVTFAPLHVASFETTAALRVCNVPPFCLPSQARTLAQIAPAPLTSIVALSLLLEGAAKPSELALSPWIVSFQAPCLLGQPATAALTVVNQGPTAVAYNWKGVEEDVDVTVTPIGAIVPPHSSTNAALAFTPTSTGEFGFPLRCLVDKDASGVIVAAWVEGHVPRPRIRLLGTEIDFGLVSVGNTATQSLTFKNESATVAKYKFSHVGANKGGVPMLKRSNSSDSMASSRLSIVSSDNSSPDDKPDVPPKCVITFHPEEGTLGPGESGSVTIVCTSGKYPERFRAAFQCELLGEPLRGASFISARGEIQCPQVYLSETKVALGTTYIGVPVSHTLNVVNVSNLPAPFKWVEPQGKSKAFSIEFDPKSGTLHSKQTLEIKITFTGRAPGYTDVVFACQVRGVLVPLGFELITLQKGLVLSYELVKPDDVAPRGAVAQDAPVVSSLPKLNFGEDVPLFERKTLRLLIRNHSGIPAKLSLEARKYNTTLDAAAVEKNPLEPRDKAYQSEPGRQYKANQANVLEDRALLSAGLGVALLCAPSSLAIAAWEQAVVTVTALNNMSGRYVDDIVVKLETMPPVRLSATINVVGCPLSINPNCVGLHMHPATDHRFPLLEYGILPLHADIVSRKVQIINTGPIPARLSWKMLEYPDPTNPERAVDVTLTVLTTGGVDVKIRPHVKKEIVVVPFSVEPMERIIPKHDHASFVMTFLPQSCALGLTRALLVADAEWLHGDQPSRPPTSQSQSPSSNQSSAKSLMMGAVGKAIKAVRLTNALGKSKSSGALNFKSNACLQLAVSGELVTPTLHWDKGTALLTFTTWSLYPVSHATHFQTMQLVNRLATKLTCRMETTGPFAIVEATSASSNHHPLSASHLSPAQRSLGFNKQPAPSFTLGPSQSVHVELHFHGGGSSSSSQPSMVVSKGQLQIRFSQGSLQTIDLQGRVLRPLLVLAPSHFKFGQVHCERTHAVRIFLSNPTEVDAHFTVQHAPPSTLPPPGIQDDPSVFRLAITSGTLRGPSLPLHTSGALVPSPSPGYTAAIHHPLEIEVTFAPAKPTKYKSRFRFHVEMGDGFDLVLEGEGTLIETKHAAGSRLVPRAAPLRHTHFMLGKVTE